LFDCQQHIDHAFPPYSLLFANIDSRLLEQLRHCARSVST